jgi:hypothetical protein
MIQEALNASHCHPKVVQQKGGCRDVVTAVGWTACREPAATAPKLAEVPIKDV